MFRSIRPDEASTIRIPTDADALCRIDVARNPISTAINGLVRLLNKCLIASTSLSWSTEEESVDIPKNNTPKPSRTSPIRRIIGFFINMTMTTPTMIKSGATASSLNDTSWPVTVVPILAPMMTPTDWERFIRPLFTKLTTSTVVALDDWMIPVNTIPSRSPINGFVVNFSRIVRIFPPATFCRPSLISCMPYKNKPTPAMICNANSIVFSISAPLCALFSTVCPVF